MNALVPQRRNTGHKLIEQFLPLHVDDLLTVEIPNIPGRVERQAQLPFAQFVVFENSFPALQRAKDSAGARSNQPLHQDHQKADMPFLLP